SWDVSIDEIGCYDFVQPTTCGLEQCRSAFTWENGLGRLSVEWGHFCLWCQRLFRTASVHPGDPPPGEDEPGHDPARTAHWVGDQPAIEGGKPQHWMLEAPAWQSAIREYAARLQMSRALRGSVVVPRALGEGQRALPPAEPLTDAVFTKPSTLDIYLAYLREH